jgi:hypothetical protein
MANLNLSEFTEKTFLADADWTFVWDTEGLISKKVSRNNWLNSGTIATSAPVTISQTWNAGAVAFTALKVNAVSTASAASSLLLDLQVGGVTKLKISKNGMLSHTDTSGNLVGFYSNNNTTYFVASDSSSDKVMGLNHGNSILFLNSSGALAWTNQARGAFNESAYADTIILRDGAANTLALRNSTAAQTFNVYGTFTTAITNFERLAIKYNATDVAYQIAAEKGSTNGDYRPLDFVTGGSRRMTIGTNGYVGIGTTAPRTLLHLNLTGGSPAIELSGATIPDFTGVGFVPNIGLNTTGRISSASVANAGLAITGFSANSNTVPAIGFFGYLGPTFPTQPAIAFVSFKHNGATGRTDLAATEISSQWSNGSTPLMTLLGSGNVGIGTTAPSSKLQVSAGDVEVDTIAKGVILKSPDGTRYRVTVANGGTLSVAAV